MDKKNLKKSFNSLGGYMLIQNVVLYATSIILVIMCLLIYMIKNVDNFKSVNYSEVVTRIASYGWIMIVSVFMAFLPMLFFRKKVFFTHDIRVKRKHINIMVILLAIVSILAISFVADYLNILIEYILRLMGLSLDKVSKSLNFTVSPSMIFYACIIAPIMEESLYRGVVLRYLEKYGRKFAIVISALMFGLMHGNLVQTPGAILAGLLLGYLASEYSLKLSIIAHMANNLFAIVFSLLNGKIPSLMLNAICGGIMIIVLIVFITMVIISCVTKHNEIKEWFKVNRTPKGMYKYFFSSVTVIIYLIINVIIIISNIGKA